MSKQHFSINVSFLILLKLEHCYRELLQKEDEVNRQACIITLGKLLVNEQAKLSQEVEDGLSDYIQSVLQLKELNEITITVELLESYAYYFFKKGKESKAYRDAKNEVERQVELERRNTLRQTEITIKEQEFQHFFTLVYDLLKSSNFIDYVQLSLHPKLPLALYYVMECYHVAFTVQEWGTWRMIMLIDENDEYLNYKKLVARKIDKDVYDKHFTNFCNGIIPSSTITETEGPKVKETKEFGWLSPTGIFTTSPFGTHEQSATEIIDKKGFTTEFKKWSETNPASLRLKRDFLVYVKGYCLIHNPCCDGGYIVSHKKPLTKYQREYLYTFFMDMGDIFKAEIPITYIR